MFPFLSDMKHQNFMHNVGISTIELHAYVYIVNAIIETMTC